ncbi:MAG TPA: S8 family serine peptidase [Tahibacter sp.]|nr:S8 family serine peptidase [Tahibacter sp.]
MQTPLVRAAFAAALFAAAQATPAADAAPMPPPDKSGIDAVTAKIHAQLRDAANAQRASLPRALAGDGTLLVEVRFTDAARARSVLAASGADVRNALGATTFEAAIAPERLRDLAGDADVVTVAPARLVRHLTGSRTSEGVAASRVDRWIAAGYDGAGVAIAVIDGFNGNGALSLQGSGDWPPSNRVTKLDYKTFGGSAPSGCNPSSFGCLGVPHGNAVLEIVYDLAPAATYRAYDTVTVGDWRRAILDAANLSASGNSLGPVRANIITASLGAPLDGKGDGSALAGSIAEAAGWARNRGVFVINAAGNERESHWGGLFSIASGGGNFHTWSGGSTEINDFVVGNGSNTFLCIPAGETITADLYWDSWQTSGSTHDYDLFLYRRVNDVTWEATPVAQSTFQQNGGSGQTPQEQIQFVTSGTATSAGCSSGRAKYGIAVTRVNSNFNRDNLQVFTNFSLRYRVAERSLGFPADSPEVFTVAAVDIANTTSTPQEWFSSEGPVLAPGGDIPNTNAATDPNLKPDVASYDNVTTISYGNGGTSPPQQTAFLGTSAATPHVAGLAAVYLQRAGIPANEAALDTTIVTPLRALAKLGTNDLGTFGLDYQYGHGRLRLQRESVLDWLQQPSNVGVNAPIAPPVQLRVLDDENYLVPVGILSSVNLALGNDPTTVAALTGGGSRSLVQGVATWTALSINVAGAGFTLRANTAGLAQATSVGFNVMSGAATRLRFVASPGTTTAGVAIAPTLQVRLEDSGGNLVGSDNTTQVSLFSPLCSGTPVRGGEPTTAVGGIATFPNVRLYQVGTAQLQATAGGLNSHSTQVFAIVPNADLIFPGVFECLP